MSQNGMRLSGFIPRLRPRTRHLSFFTRGRLRIEAMESRFESLRVRPRSILGRRIRRFYHPYLSWEGALSALGIWHQTYISRESRITRIHSRTHHRWPWYVLVPASWMKKNYFRPTLITYLCKKFCHHHAPRCPKALITSPLPRPSFSELPLDPTRRPTPWTCCAVRISVNKRCQEHVSFPRLSSSVVDVPYVLNQDFKVRLGWFRHYHRTHNQRAGICRKPTISAMGSTQGRPLRSARNEVTRATCPVVTGGCGFCKVRPYRCFPLCPFNLSHKQSHYFAWAPRWSARANSTAFRRTRR